jgi:hypothetical protein
MMEEVEKFEYEAPAELYSSGSVGSRKHPVSYRRFASGAEAIRFAIEELPQLLQRSTVMEAGDSRFEFAAIRALYDSEDYPLARDVGADADRTP